MVTNNPSSAKPIKKLSKELLDIQKQVKKFNRIIAGYMIKISSVQEQLKNIQKTCSHPQNQCVETYGSNVGNYDPHEDEYWTNYHCQICDQKWTIYKKARVYF